jgi:hypothetical protein
MMLITNQGVPKIGIGHSEQNSGAPTSKQSIDCCDTSTAVHACSASPCFVRPFCLRHGCFDLYFQADAYRLPQED